jgi:flagellin-like hook-associated protein FlgL
MRISSLQYFQQSVQTLNAAQSKVAQLQAQIASGASVGQASENPEAFLTAITAQQNIVEAEQYNRNSVVVSTRFNQQENLLGTLTEAFSAVRDSALASKNALLAPTDRAALAIEVRARAQEILGTLNAKDFNGDALFSLASDSRSPLNEDGTLNTSLNTDNTSPKVRISRSSEIPLGNVDQGILRDPSDPSGLRSVFQMLESLAVAIENGDQAAIDSGLGATEKAGDNALKARVGMGICLQRLDEAQSLNDTEIFEAERVKSESVGIDLAKTISTLVQTDAQLKALQTTYSQVARSSLFDLI